MKSPLVEALRQAHGQTNDDNKPATDRPATLPEDQPGIEAKRNLLDDVTPPADELSLLDATDVLVVADATNDANDIDDADLTATGVGTVVDEPDPHAMVRPTRAAVPHGMAMPKGAQRGMPRLGRFSPLICLLLAGGAMGAYFAYQNLGGTYENVDLAALSSQLGSSSASALSDLVEPEHQVNRFQLIEVPSSPRPRRRTIHQAEPPSAVAPTTALPARLPERRSVSTVRSSSVEDRAFDVLNVAYDAYERGDIEAAEAGYRRALAIAPRHPNGLQGLAAILHSTGRIAESLEHYESLLSLDPDNTAAAAALLAGRGASALSPTESDVKLLIQRHPQSAHLHFALGALLARQSRWPDARVAFEDALDINPRNAAYLFNLAVTLEHLGQFDAARGRYESALATADSNSSVDSNTVIARIAQLSARSESERRVQ